MSSDDFVTKGDRYYNCPVCGKQFFANAKVWAYKLCNKNNHPVPYCSWSCMRAEERRRQEERDAKKAKALEARLAKKEAERAEREKARKQLVLDNKEAKQVSEKKRAKPKKPKETKKVVKVIEDPEEVKRKAREILSQVDWNRPDKKIGSFEPTASKLGTLAFRAGYAADSNGGKSYIMSKIPAESWYQKRIMDYIKSRAQSEGRECIVNKIGQGACSSRNGIADVMAVVDGVPFAFEVKRPLVGKASDPQLKWMCEWKRAGGHGGFAVYTDDVDTAWEGVQWAKK